MSALVIVIVAVAGAVAYIATVVYVYFRLAWHQHQRDSYAMGEAAFFPAVMLPWGIVLLWVYDHGGVERHGIPPRSVKRERLVKKQQEEIARLEQELGIR